MRRYGERRDVRRLAGEKEGEEEGEPGGVLFSK
jgi:hypothetical protein